MKICIISPVKDSIQEPAVASVVALAMHLTRQGHDVVRRSTWLSSNLAQARALLVREALATGAERVLFLDDDIVFDPADFDCLAVLDVGDDIVSGSYKRRATDGEWVGAPLEGGTDRGALLAMHHVGMGFALMTRGCLLRMVEAHGDGAFEFRYDGTMVTGEDKIFCSRWRELGGRIWLHTGVQLGHVGPNIFR